MWASASSWDNRNTVILSSTTILWIQQGDNTLLYKNLSKQIFLIGIPIFVLAVMGIINAAKGLAKELPIIGKIKIMK